MASQLLRIQMAGGGPYGFRLLGGDKSPLTVAKIRPSSKAQVAGLLEGDVILAINNICSQGLSHAAATALMEGNNPALTVHALRGRNALSEVDSVTASLGPEIQRLTASEASALVQNSPATSGNDPVMNGTQPEVQFRLQAPPSGGSLKQMRIARRESRSSDIQTPDDALGQSSQDTPGYYAREERTSTDGGKTTRTVEEVKTEKFGGTTLTKVTKQEFSSFTSSSAGPRVGQFPPEFSVIRSEEQGYPVRLGAPSEGENQRRDERGWTANTSVHKSSVTTEPYEVRIDTTQEPERTYVIYQDGSKDNIEKPRVSQVQQPIPSIEIQFRPNESRFGIETKPPREEASSNFEIRVGKEVTFQPKIQRSNETTQSQSEFHAAPKVHGPSIQNQTGTYSKCSYESNQSNYGNQPQTNYGYVSKSGYLEKQIPEPQPQYANRNESQYAADSHRVPKVHEPSVQSQSGTYSKISHESNQSTYGNQLQFNYGYLEKQNKHGNSNESQYNAASLLQFGHTRDSQPGSQPQFGFSEEPDYPYKPSVNRHLEQAAKLQPATHILSDSGKPESRNKSETNPQFGCDSEPQPYTQSQFGYNPELHPITQPKFGYNPEHQSETHRQHGYYQEPQAETNCQVGHNPESQTGTESQYRYHPEPQPRTQSQHGYNPEPQPRTQSQHGYNPEPQPRTQSQDGYNSASQLNTHLQVGYSREPAYPYKPGGHLQYDNNPEPLQPEYNKPDSHLYRGYKPEIEHVTNPQFGCNSQSEPQFQPSQPAYNPEPQHKPGAHPQNTHEPEPPPTDYNKYPTRAAPTSLNRQAEPQFYDAAPSAQAAPAPWEKFPHGPVRNLPPDNYNPPEAAYGASPFALDRGPIKPRQMDRVERVEIATAPKWIPGSKLPTKQPSKPLTTENSNPPLIDDHRGPQAENPVAKDGYYDQPPEGGWYEAPVAGVRSHSNVAFARVHDPSKQSTEIDQFVEYGNAPRPVPEYEAAAYHPPYGQGEEGIPSGQWSAFGGHSNPSATGRLPVQANVWRPPGFGSAGQAGTDEMDRSRGYGPNPVYQPPPPAPHLVPIMVESVPPPPTGYHLEPTPLAPPPPVAPPIDYLKIYRGNSSSDRGYGFTTLEDRVKMANSVAHSVLSPENQNSRGQKMFLRRREISHKWTMQGPDPVPETPDLQESNRSNPNVWAPKSPGISQPRPLLPSALAPQPLVQDIRQEEPPSAGSYSLTEDAALNNGRGGLLFAKRRAKADQWASAEFTGQQAAPQTIRQGAPQPPVGYGASAVPPSVGYNNSQSAGRVEGGMGGDGYPITNRLKDMIKPKNPSALWNQQTAPQSPFAQDGQSRGPSSFGTGSNLNPGNRMIRLQGTSVISSSPVAPSAVQPQNFMRAQHFTPKQFGNRAIVGQAAGYTDL